MQLTITEVARITVTMICVFFATTASAGNFDWQTTGMLQGYYRNYAESESRKKAYNIGAYLFADYLETVSLSLGYNYTFVELKSDGEVDENMFHLGGKYSWSSTALSGKISIAMDGYRGEYTTTTKGSGAGVAGVSGGSVVNLTESTDIAVIHPQVSFINFARTLYLDLGYAYSEYDSDSFYDIEAHQITPAIGLGWNNAYDWLQLRGYFINIDQQTRILNDDDFTSAELKYIHWFQRKSPPYFDNIRLTLLAGERVLAVDSYAKTVNSVSDKQTGAVSMAGQWTVSTSLKLMLLVSYDEFANDVLADEYNSLLVYGNLQSQW